MTFDVIRSTPGLGSSGDYRAKREFNVLMWLAKYRAKAGDVGAYEYATIYAQWGDRVKALEWLATATRLRDPGLVLLKTDPLMDPLRYEPRFQAIERQLKFPS
jgi:hypothetical protein